MSKIFKNRMPRMLCAMAAEQDLVMAFEFCV